ncbi:MAG: ribose-5-phosphate isomerase RpiA [Deltaproteobacteria bacterium]|nr:ribose-5-phosphate isomerase RpiA [Deltaproteobacteria bacterium]
MKDTRSNPETKKLAGVQAARLIQDGMLVGIGTGSTIAFLIKELGRRVREEGIRITGVPTSFQSRLSCNQLGIPVREMQDCAALDLALDGADEVDPDLNVIKGGGGSQTREKIVAAMAREFVVVVDESKLVATLGAAFPIPVEVLPSGLAYVERAIRDLGASPALRIATSGKDGPVVTDNGQFILDVRFPPGTDLRAADERMHRIPGVLETGLFLDLAGKVVVGGGSADGPAVRTLMRAK